MCINDDGLEVTDTTLIGESNLYDLLENLGHRVDFAGAVAMPLPMVNAAARELGASAMARPLISYGAYCEPEQIPMMKVLVGDRHTGVREVVVEVPKAIRDQWRDIANLTHQQSQDRAA